MPCRKVLKRETKVKKDVVKIVIQVIHVSIFPGFYQSFKTEDSSPAFLRISIIRK